MKAPWILLGIVLAMALCSGCDEESPPSCEDLDYPQCTSEGALLECVGGQVLERECAQGQACLELISEDGIRFTQCVEEGSQPCDGEEAVPACIDEGAVRSCQWPLGAPEAGHTIRVECDPGQICQTGPLQGACTSPDSLPCVPDAFEGACDGEAPVRCSALGFTSRDEACAAPETCKVGAEGAVCTQQGAQPCEWTDFDRVCDGNAVVSCDPFDAFTESTPCAAEEECLASANNARCFGPEHPRCEEGFEERCDGNARVLCNGFGVEEVVACEEDSQCKVGPRGAHCVEPDSEPCDSWETTCDQGAELHCSSVTGFTFHIACQEGFVCRSGENGGFCVDESAEPCDFSTFISTCDGQVRTYCSFLTGYSDTERCEGEVVCRDIGHGARCVSPEAETCEPGTHKASCEAGVALSCLPEGFVERVECAAPASCLADEACLFGLCDTYAFCLDTSEVSACEEPQEVACQEREVVDCFDGMELRTTCGEEYQCVTDGQRYACAPNDAPTCDPNTFVERCDGDEVIWCLGEDEQAREVRMDCGWLGMGCAEDGEVRCQ